MKEHKPGCPKSQFWDAGEWQAPCTCGERLRKYFDTKYLKSRLKRWLESEQVRIRAMEDGYNLAPGDKMAYRHICQLIETYNQDKVRQ